MNMTTTEATPSAAFPEARGREKGYEKKAVDAFLARARDAFEVGGEPLTAAEVRQVSFALVRHGYAIASVDAALDLGRRSPLLAKFPENRWRAMSWVIIFKT